MMDRPAVIAVALVDVQRYLVEQKYAPAKILVDALVDLCSGGVVLDALSTEEARMIAAARQMRETLRKLSTTQLDLDDSPRRS